MRKQFLPNQVVQVEDRVQQAELDAPHKASAVELTPSITAMPPILYDADTQTDVVVSMDEIVCFGVMVYKTMN